MLDVVTLARESAAFLAPFLPYLLKAGANFTEEAGKKLGEQVGGGAWEKAKSLWNKLWPKVEAKPAAEEAAKDVAAAPQDEDALAVLRQQLKKIFTEDKALAEEVFKLHEEARRDGVNLSAVGDSNVLVGHDMTGSTVIIGDKNRAREK